MTRTFAYNTADAIEELKEIQIEGRKKLTAKTAAAVRFLFTETASENKYHLPANMRSKLYL